jgi:hypothetical protein
VWPPGSSVCSSKNAPQGEHPTALDQSDLSELLTALKTGDGVDLVRDAVRLVLQELVEAEATAAIGAGRDERRGTDAAISPTGSLPGSACPAGWGSGWPRRSPGRCAAWSPSQLSPSG